MDVTRRGFLKFAFTTGVASIVPFVVPPAVAAIAKIQDLPQLPEGTPFFIRNWQMSMSRENDRHDTYGIELVLEGRFEQQMNSRSLVRLTIDAPSREEMRKVSEIIHAGDVVYIDIHSFRQAMYDRSELGPFKNISSLSVEYLYDQCEMRTLDGRIYSF